MVISTVTALLGEYAIKKTLSGFMLSMVWNLTGNVRAKEVLIVGAGVA
jgi:hypothetical protein